MDWTTILLGLIKGTFAIFADDYVYRARQARTRARKHAPPQPKVDDWAQPTKPAAATPIIIETEEGRHFAASSFIAVEGYAQTRTQKARQPGESRRTRRKRAMAPEVEHLQEDIGPCGLAKEDVLPEAAQPEPSAETQPPAAPGRAQAVMVAASEAEPAGLVDVVVEDALSDHVFAPLALPGSHTANEEPGQSLAMSVPVELLGACRHVRILHERRRLLQHLTARRRARRLERHALAPPLACPSTGRDHNNEGREYGRS